MKKILIGVFLIMSSLAYAETYYVAPLTHTPAGNDAAAGDINHPWLTWGKAFRSAMPGDTVFFFGGTYNTEVTDGRGIKYSPGDGVGYNGTVNDTICYFNVPGEVPVLDCAGSTASYDDVYNYGLFFYRVNYVYLKGLQIKNVKQRPSRNDVCMGLYNWQCRLKLEHMDIGNVDGYAFRTIQSFDVRVINCDAHDCCDYNHATMPGNWGGGFGGGNGTFEDGYLLYRGCRAWKCSDQGFCASGSISLVVFDNCWSFDNGTMPGNLTGEGHGWKLGYWANPTTVVPCCIVQNCIAAYNGRGPGIGDGFNDNQRESEPAGVYYLYNNFAYKNGRNGVNINPTTSPDDVEMKRLIINNVSLENYKSDLNDYLALYTSITNSWSPGEEIDESDFENYDLLLLYQDRDPLTGKLPDINFGKPIPESDPVDAGTYVGIDFSGENPDIGWYELTSASGGNVYPVVSITNPLNNSTFEAPLSITLSADASDSDGTIDRVAYFNGTTSIGESSTGPAYEVLFNCVNAGVFNLSAVAHDNDGGLAKSSTVTITITIPPSDEEEPSGQVMLFPSPNDGHFTLNLSASLQAGRKNVLIANSSGTVVNSSYIEEEEYSKEYDLQELIAGTYVLIIVSGGKIAATKTFSKK